MNIISNNCFSGLVTSRIFNSQAENPFFYVWMRDEDFIKLVENWDSIDLHNISSCYVDDDYLSTLSESEVKRFKSGWNKTGNKVLGSIIVDDLVRVNFVHYNEVPENKKEKVVGTDRKVHNLLEYLKSKWFERLERMNGEPFFVAHIDKSCNIERMIELKHKSKYPFYICAPSIKRMIPYNDEIDFLVPRSDYDMWNIKGYVKFANENENFRKAFNIDRTFEYVKLSR